jgi:hypothetical protein
LRDQRTLPSRRKGRAARPVPAQGMMRALATCNVLFISS